jgi:glycosyltransferase involved in cell wall biosynthesis
VFATEWSPAFPESRKNGLKEEEFFRHAFSKSDAAIVISEFLQERVLSIGGGSVPALRVPIVCDARAYQPNSNGKSVSYRYLLYVASVDAYFEDTAFVIEAFSLIRDDSLCLRIVGNCNDKNLADLNRLAVRLGVNERVLFNSNYIRIGDLFHITSSAKLLLAPFENTTRNQARFPFKLGEYLLSGRPVVAHATGEIAHYLLDGVDAYLCGDDGVEEFAARISFALSDPKANSVGLAGKRTAEKNFDYKIVSQSIIRFLDELDD